MAARGRDDKGFLSRWSQRKREAEEAAAREAVPPQEDDEALPAAPSAAAGAAEEDAIDLRDLPDIDRLHAGSDFTVFMRSGIPGALKQRALRRLWQVDPAFNVICPLDDYNLDYTDAATVVPNLKTLYQVGRGMVLPGEDAEETPAVDAAPVPEKLALQGAAPPDGDAAAAEPEAADANAEEVEDDNRAAARPLAAGSSAPAAIPQGARPPRAAPLSGKATPQKPSASPAARSATRSARRRRWGDSDA
jgi:hypothetical protein